MTFPRQITFCFAAIVALSGFRAPPESVWRNPSNSVHVRFDNCGDRLCGTVIWANAKAIADTRRGSGTELVGTQIFRELRPVRPNVWKGKLFVPDIAKTFGGTLTRVAPNQLVGKGCLLIGLGCKSQVWTQISN